MGLNLQYPIPTYRMGAMLAAWGMKNCAIVEFGPMGTANYFDRALASYGLSGEKHPHFAVHTTDMELSLGCYDQLAAAIKEVLCRCRPELIFVFPSPVLGVVGVDVEGLILEMGDISPVPIVVIPVSSFSALYPAGAKSLLDKLMPFVREPEAVQPLTYQILGLLPDDFHFQSDLNALKAMLLRYFGARCVCTFPYDCTPAKLAQLSQAQVNLVLRSEAMGCAAFLQEKFGTPFVFARPYGPAQTRHLCEEVARATGWKLNEDLLARDCEQTAQLLHSAALSWRRDRTAGFDRSVLLCAHEDTAAGMAAFLETELQLSVTAFSSAPISGRLPQWRAEEWEQLISSHPRSVLLADGSSQALYGSRTAVISHPALRFRDLTGQQPFLGLSGALNLMQLIDDHRPL